MEDCRLPDFPLALHNQLIQEAHSIRKYWFGNFYVLAGDNVDPTGWCVLQYHLPDTEEGIVVAFRRPDSPYKVFQCQLHDIDNREYSNYKLRRSYNPTVPHQWDIRSGVFLSMLHIDIESAPGSCIVEYKKCS